MDPRKMATKIKRTKGEWRKSMAYLESYGADREAVLREILFSLEPGAYVLSDGEFGRSIYRAVADVAGTFAGLDVTGKFLFGLSTLFPERIRVSFTLGLNEIRILARKRSRSN